MAGGPPSSDASGIATGPESAIDMLLVPPLLLPLLIYGRVIQKQGKAGPAASIYESSLPTVVAAIVLPTALGNFWLPTASVVAAILIVLYGLLALVWRDEVLLYPLPILIAHLYFNGWAVAGLSDPMVGLLFLPLGLLAMIVAVWLQRRGAGPVRIFFLAWFVFSGASVLGAVSDRTLTTYLIAGWAALYALAASFMNRAGYRQPVVEAGSNV